MSNHSNDKQTINMIYSENLKVQDKDVTLISLIKSVIHIGISRHIRVMLDVINDPLHKDVLGPYSKSQLLEWTISSNSYKTEIHVLLGYINAKNVSLVNDWQDVRQFFTSQISEHMCRTQCESITDSIVHRILERMLISAKNCRTDEKANAIAWLLSEICKAMKEEDQGATWEAILVGSAAECTQALFIDEFDYLLLRHSQLDRSFIKKTLKSAVSKMTNIYHPRLALESMTLDTNQSYPRLYYSHVAAGTLVPGDKG